MHAGTPNGWKPRQQPNDQWFLACPQHHDITIPASLRQVRAMPDSIGYDLFTPIDFRIKPKAHKVIFLDYVLGLPEGYYGRITSKSGLALDYGIDVNPGVVNRGYQGNIGVILKK